jgi:hypothetical protein
VAITFLVLLVSGLVTVLLFAVHCVVYLQSVSLLRKLEPALRAAIAERDIDKAADLCERFKGAATAPIVSSLIAQTRVVPPSSPVSIEEFKRVWTSSTSSEFSMWMNAARFAHWTRLIVLVAPAMNLLVDISRSLKEIDLISEDGGYFLYFVLRRELPVLSFGIFVAILAFVVEEIVTSQATKRKLRTDDLAIDLLVNYSGKPRRASSKRYQPGGWMSSTGTGPGPHPSLSAKSHHRSGRTVGAVVPSGSRSFPGIARILRAKS